MTSPRTRSKPRFGDLHQPGHAQGRDRVFRACHQGQGEIGLDLAQVPDWLASANLNLRYPVAKDVSLTSNILGLPSRIIRRHILPNVVSPVMVAATLGVAEAIITESVLSFLGLGFPPDFPTWGRLLYDGLQYMQVYPERVVWPGLAISLTVLSVNYIGDGLRDALDPKLKRS